MEIMRKKVRRNMSDARFFIKCPLARTFDYALRISRYALYIPEFSLLAEVPRGFI